MFYMHIYTKKELTENGDFRVFAANGKRKQQITFVSCNRKQKMEVCLPWSANNTQYLTIAVSANVPIDGKTTEEHDLKECSFCPTYDMRLAETG
jgi:hypothetical protein